VALVVGANDTVNPAAKTTPGSPIYGMPIINADEAQNIIFLKRSMRPGFGPNRGSPPSTVMITHGTGR
jgi:NAD(P) transhydrogenase subunit beta